MEKITFQNLSFRYPESEFDALREVDLTIIPAQFVLVCGQSGCGKSTLLRHLKKSLTPYGERSGQVCYGETEISKMDLRTSAQTIGFVLQSPESQIVTDKVWHELAFGLENLGCRRQEIRRRVAEMASFFGIEPWFRKNISELSGGQKQLLNLASVMVMQPDVLVLDEPTSQLDPIAATEFLETLLKINRELGTTVILSEHRLEEVFPLADQVVVMEKGRVSLNGTPEEVGRALCREKGSHPMYFGLPAFMKIYAEVKPEGPCPLTVRDGRNWLQALMAEKGTGFTATEERGGNGGKTDAAFSLADVWFRYSRSGEDVLRGLSLAVRKGELTCVVGGNGVGKSTLLKIVAGLLKPYTGKLLAGKKPLKKADCNIGMLPQNPQAVFTEITVEEELYDMLYQEHLSEEERLAQISRMLEQMKLSHLRQANPYDLSGGEQQRLALGKILMMQPEVLLLDEPTKGLDPFFKRTFAGILQQLKENGTTILMVTHDIEFCAQYADRCAMLFDGEIVCDETPQKFFGSNRFYTTTASRMSRGIFQNAVTSADVVRLCRENGL